MTAKNQSFICEKGTSFQRIVTWLDQDNQPVDVTSYSAKMQVKKDAASPLIIELSTANDRINVGGVNGEVELLLTAAETAALAAGDFRYDLEMTSPLGEVTRIIQGVFSVTAEITV